MYSVALRDDAHVYVTSSHSRVADYFAQLNNKMGGDLKKIQTVGEYMVEIWKAVGMEGITADNSGAVQFLSASEEINR